MLGAVIALRRVEHMRLGFLVSRAPPRLRAFIETLATTVVLVFVLAIIWPALDYADFAAADHHPGARDFGRLPRRRHRGRRRPDAADCRRAPDRARQPAPGPARARDPGCGRGRAVARRARAVGDGQLQSGDLLRRPGRRPGRARGADRLRVRSFDARLSGLHHPNPAHHRDQPHGCRHVRPHSPGGAAVRVSRPDDGDGGAGARAGGFHRRAARPCARRARLCAARRHVSGLRHLRLQGRRHGGGGAGPVPGDETARRASRANWWRCWRRRAPCRRPSRPAWC